jgi:hypothetical protein
MEKTKALTYAMHRAKAEAAVHQQEVHPEHLFMDDNFTETQRKARLPVLSAKTLAICCCSVS